MNDDLRGSYRATIRSVTSVDQSKDSSLEKIFFFFFDRGVVKENAPNLLEEVSKRIWSLSSYNIAKFDFNDRQFHPPDNVFMIGMSEKRKGNSFDPVRSSSKELEEKKSQT